MIFAEEFKHTLFEINEKNFNDSSLAAFEYQYYSCELYKDYCNNLQRTPKTVKSLLEIPFIPIEFFKNHAIKSGSWKENKIFKSSGTTDTGRSQHFIKDLDHYHNSAKRAFENHFGSLSNYKIIAILPSYQSQGDSSLISMVDYFLQFSLPDSGYFINNDLKDLLQDSVQKLIVGVSYALLDLAESHFNTRNAIVMETGGMKGRRKEIIRHELHAALKKGFGVDQIWSEYGMTELQSQAYGKNGTFQFAPWAKCFIRDINDPFTYLPDYKTGGINIIDLANIDSCCFIETKDLGILNNDTFEVLGRFDNSDIRGCNLMI
ncbi:acyl transferase [Ekhidna sp. To15]|uniref:LuxE/PaaK family acyltransferase n=1 Tax=Ekhidna sp. To15 TaxID=3395267 RepID=UPI003F52485D